MARESLDLMTRGLDFDKRVKLPATHDGTASNRVNYRLTERGRKNEAERESKEGTPEKTDASATVSLYDMQIVGNKKKVVNYTCAPACRWLRHPSV